MVAQEDSIGFDTGLVTRSQDSDSSPTIPPAETTSAEPTSSPPTQSTPPPTSKSVDPPPTTKAVDTPPVTKPAVDSTTKPVQQPDPPKTQVAPAKTPPAQAPPAQEPSAPVQQSNNGEGATAATPTAPAANNNVVVPSQQPQQTTQQQEQQQPAQQSSQQIQSTQQAQAPQQTESPKQQSLAPQESVTSKDPQTPQKSQNAQQSKTPQASQAIQQSQETEQSQAPQAASKQSEGATIPTVVPVVALVAPTASISTATAEITQVTSAKGPLVSATAASSGSSQSEATQSNGETQFPSRPTTGTAPDSSKAPELSSALVHVIVSPTALPSVYSVPDPVSTSKYTPAATTAFGPSSKHPFSADAGIYIDTGHPSISSVTPTDGNSNLNPNQSTPDPTSNSTSSSSSTVGTLPGGSGTSSGTKVGIGLGVLVGVGMILLGVYLLIRHRKRRQFVHRRDTEQTEDNIVSDDDEEGNDDVVAATHRDEKHRSQFYDSAGNPRPELTTSPRPPRPRGSELPGYLQRDPELPGVFTRDPELAGPTPPRRHHEMVTRNNAHEAQTRYNSHEVSGSHGGASDPELISPISAIELESPLPAWWGEKLPEYESPTSPQMGLAVMERLGRKWEIPARANSITGSVRTLKPSGSHLAERRSPPPPPPPRNGSGHVRARTGSGTLSSRGLENPFLTRKRSVRVNTGAAAAPTRGSPSTAGMENPFLNAYKERDSPSTVSTNSPGTENEAGNTGASPIIPPRSSLRTQAQGHVADSLKGWERVARRVTSREEEEEGRMRSPGMADLL